MSERPDRQKQADVIVNSLRRSIQRTAPPPSKKIKRQKRRTNRSSPSPSLSGQSAASYQLLRTADGKAKKVRFKVLEQPPAEEPVRQVNVGLAMYNVLQRLIKDKFVTENFYSYVSVDPESNAVLLRNQENGDDCFELCRGGASAVAVGGGGAAEAVLDRETVQLMKEKFKIEYLF